MELFLRDNDLTDWIELDGGVSLKIAYPTYEQELDLSAKFMNISISEDKDTKSLIEYFTNLVKYCVKDWKGINDKKTGEPVKCEIVNGQISAPLMAALVRDPMLMADWGGRIKQQIDFTETDKKK